MLFTGQNLKRGQLTYFMNEVLLINSPSLKSVRVRSFSGPCFPAFGLNTERYSVSLCIQSECGKIRARKTLNTDTLHTASSTYFLSEFLTESVTVHVSICSKGNKWGDKNKEKYILTFLRCWCWRIHVFLMQSYK